MKWLRLTEPRMRGPEVTRLQEILMALGYDIGSTGCDGIFGPDTSNAVKMLQRRHGLISDGAVGNLETWPFLQDLWRVQVRKNPVSATKITLVDRRGLHEPPRLYRKDLSPRPWSGEGQTVIRGVTLHQTGCILSEYPRMYDLGNFHIVILQNGTIILVNPFEWFIWHANDLSFATIGIEFHGNMPGIHDRPETVWNEGAEPNDLTDAQIRAADLLFGWLQHQFQINGGKKRHGVLAAVVIPARCRGNPVTAAGAYDSVAL